MPNRKNTPLTKPEAVAYERALNLYRNLCKGYFIKLDDYGQDKHTSTTLNFLACLKKFIPQELVAYITNTLSGINLYYFNNDLTFKGQQINDVKLHLLKIECLLHGEWWNNEMNYQYELAMQKNSTIAINHCQQVIELVERQKHTFVMPEDEYPKLWACKVAYSLGHFPENRVQNSANFKILNRLHTEHPMREVFLPFWEEAQSMQMRIERGLSPTSVHGKLIAM